MPRAGASCKCLLSRADLIFGVKPLSRSVGEGLCYSNAFPPGKYNALKRMIRSHFPMHGLTYTMLIALANSIDNLGAWIAFSLKGIKITLQLNLWISFVTFIISVAATFAGEMLLGVLDSRVCAWISMAIFVIMGAWFILEPFFKHRKHESDGNVIINILENPEEADLNKSKDIDFKEATLLGIALSINNAGGSFSAGMIGLDPWLIGVFSAVISFGALWVGKWISLLFTRFRLGDKAAVISGAILILIGIKQIL